MWTGRPEAANTYFNPPTPWGVGRFQVGGQWVTKKFQSTHPVGGGTHGPGQLPLRSLISIHPPRGGWDLIFHSCWHSPCHFNPPTPWGVGPLAWVFPSASRKFQSTHPVGGGTCGYAVADALAKFQSTHPVGGGTKRIEVFGNHDTISIHPPRGGWDKVLQTVIDIAGISIHPPRGGWDYPDIPGL